MYGGGSFETETEPKWYVLSTTLTMLATALAAAVALWFFTQTPGPTLYVLVLSLLTCGVMALVLSKKPPVQISISGSRMTVRDADGRDYRIPNISALDLILKQNGLEKKTNVGRLQIKGTGLYLYGVKHFEELRRYIEDHLS